MLAQEVDYTIEWVSLHGMGIYKTKYFTLEQPIYRKGASLKILVWITTWNITASVWTKFALAPVFGAK